MMRPLPLLALAAATLTGCGSGIREVSVLPAPSGRQAMADSTTRLVSVAALAADTAMLKIRVAASTTSLVDARALVLNARSATASASANVDAAIRQGDWLRDEVAGDVVTRGGQYARYWRLGRAKLDAARQLSASAVAVADSALSCTETGCAAQRTRLMQAHVEAAAGAAREAEGVVRIAMVHVH